MNAISRDCRRRQDMFLEAYARHGIVGAAAAECGIPLGTIESWVLADTQGFKTRKAESEQLAMGVLESELHRRAVTGSDKPIIYKGTITGYYKEWSDNLLMFRLKRLNPEYKDNYQVPASTPTHATQINIHLHPDIVKNSSSDGNGVVDSDN